MATPAETVAILRLPTARSCSSVRRVRALPMRGPKSKDFDSADGVSLQQLTGDDQMLKLVGTTADEEQWRVSIVTFDSEVF
jgi:hypothetical protein